MHTATERSLVLIGSIVTLSAALLPFRTIYFGKTIFPNIYNIYLFVPGPAGAGKGKLDFCFRLVKPIHKEKRQRWLTAQDEYKKEYARYKRQKKGENIDPPEKPPIQLFRVPANSSATSFAQAMAENGNLLIFETEGDTIVNTFSSDYGDYSDSFRKAYAHESFGYLRRGDDGEEREIDNPRLATVLSGTPEQVKSLIRDAENGLLSRFIFFCINSTPQWLDGFDSYGSDVPLEESFDAIGARFAAFAKLLEDTPKITFRLSLAQMGKFNDYFAAEKQRMEDFNGDRYSASSHRLAWCFLRISMVLTALRMMDSGQITENVECSDVDFDITMELIRVISVHNDYIFNVLDRERPEGIAVADSYSSATRKNHPGRAARLLQDRRHEDGGQEHRQKSQDGAQTGRPGHRSWRDTAGEARRVQKTVAGMTRHGLEFNALSRIPAPLPPALSRCKSERWGLKVLISDEKL